MTHDDSTQAAPDPTPPGTRIRSVAVVGAGISGLAAARTLHDQGFAVRVFERSRAPGGRTAHRRAGGHGFDHGAQYFTARDPRFVRRCEDWVEAGVVAPWAGRIVSLAAPAPAATSAQARYVGVPGMNAMAQHLAGGLDVVTRYAVLDLARDAGTWWLRGGQGDEGSDGVAGPFDALVLAMPPEQAARLTTLDTLAGTAGATTSLPCWCAMAAFDEPLPVDFDGAFVDGAEIAWIARDSSKPGRAAGERWVIHAGPEWSAPRLADPPDAIAQALLDRFFAALRVAPRPPAHLAGHRWSLARPAHELRIECLWQPRPALALCGDWCLGGRVEGAFLSGVAAAGRIAAADVHQGIG